MGRSAVAGFRPIFKWISAHAGAPTLAMTVLLSCWLGWAQAPPAARFPEADQKLETVWASISAEQAHFQEAPAPQLKEWVKRRLAHLYTVEQKALGEYINPRPAGWSTEEKEYYTRKLAARIIALEDADTAELKELLKRYRWFTVSEFGADADMHAWVIVQHSDRDPAFQREVLAILGTLHQSGESSASNYANLYDRVEMNAGKPQRYGTQGNCEGPGQWVPYQIADTAGLDERRKSLGLSTMAEYLQRSKDKKYCP